MPVIWCSGDLFVVTRQTRAIALWCDCSGRLPGRVGDEVRRRWPEMFAAYRQRCVAGRLEPGDVFSWQTETGRAVFHLAVRRHWRTPPQRHWMACALTALLAETERLRIGRVALAAVGEPGSDWPSVRPILDEIGMGHPVTLLAIREHRPDRPVRRLDTGSRQLALGSEAVGAQDAEEEGVDKKTG